MIKIHIKKNQLENQETQEHRQVQFFQKFFDEQKNLKCEEREKRIAKFFIQLSTISKGKQNDII